MKTILSSAHLREPLLRRMADAGRLTGYSFRSLNTLLTAQEESLETLFDFARILHESEGYAIYGKMFVYPAFVREVLDFARECALYGITADDLPAETASDTELKRMIASALSLPLKEKELYVQRDRYLADAQCLDIEIFPEFMHDPYHFYFQKDLCEFGTVHSLAAKNSTYVLRTAQNPRMEIEAIAQDIIRSDVPCNVVLADFSVQYPLLKQIFERYHIPFYTAVGEQKPRTPELFLSLLDLAEKKDAQSLLTAVERNAFGIPAPEKLIPFIRDTFTGTKIPEVSAYLTLEVYKNDARRMKYAEELAHDYFAKIQEDLDSLLDAGSYEEILSAAYAILQKHPYMKDSGELAAGLEIRKLLSCVPKTITAGDLAIIRDHLKHITLQYSLPFSDFCTVTDLTHPVFAQKRAYIAGCTARAYPAVPARKGLFDERYVRSVPGYPSLQERHDIYTGQLAWIRSCADMIIFSAPLGDYAGKTLQTSFEITELCGSGTPWTMDTVRPMSLPGHTLTPETARELYRDEDGRIHGSVSRIENWFACRYRYFLSSALQVREDDAGTLDARTVGNIAHAFFQDSIRDLRKNYEKYTLEDIDRYLVPYFNQLVSLIPKDEHLADLTSARLLQNIRDSLDILAVIEANNLYHPVCIEEEINSTMFEGLHFYGRIDRIDEVNGKFRIVDYKSSEKSLSETRVKAGLQLQLLTYLVLAEEKLQETPAGAYYFSVKPESIPLSAGSFSASKGYTENGTPTGEELFAAQLKEHLFNGWATEKPDDEYTDYSLFQKPGSKIFDYELIRQCMTELYQYFNEHADSGDISDDPDKEACAYCPYRRICRHYLTDVREIRPVVMADTPLAKGKEEN